LANKLASLTKFWLFWPIDRIWSIAQVFGQIKSFFFSGHPLLAYDDELLSGASIGVIIEVEGATYNAYNLIMG
jgi:hypothetical protein